MFWTQNSSSPWGSVGYRLDSGGTYFYFSPIGVNIPLSITALQEMVANIASSKVTVNINGTEYSGSGTASMTSNPLFLFCRNSGGTAEQYAAATLYYFSISDANGNLLRDFIPVKSINDLAIGLYDKVNDKFYPNNGSGTFTAGSTIGVIY